MAGILPDWLGGLFDGSSGGFSPMGGGVLNPTPTGQPANFNDMMAQNRQALLGFGMGMLGGDSRQGAWSGALQGMQRGNLMDAAAMKAASEKAQREKRQAALLALSKKYGLDPAVADDPELAQKAIADRLAPDNGQIVQSNGKYYRVFKDPSKPAQPVSGIEAEQEWKQATNPSTGQTILYDPRNPDSRKEIFPGVKTPSDMKPVTKKAADGTEVTIGYITPQGKMVSVQEAEEAFGVQPGSTGSGDGMTKALKEKMDKNRADQIQELQDTGKSSDRTAAAAASAGDFIKRFVPEGAIGPVVGSGPSRTIAGIFGTTGEKTRQMAEQQLNALGAEYRKSVYQGTGAVSDKETEYALRVLGNPASFDKGTVLAAVKHIEEKSRYQSGFRDFFQQNQEKFKYDPTVAWIEYQKQKPFSANEQIAKAAKLEETTDSYNNAKDKPKSGVPELKKGETVRRGRATIERVD